MRKFLVTLLGIVISNNSYALKIYNGQLISSKIETSSHATGEFLPDKFVSSSQDVTGAARAGAKAFSRSGRVGDNIAINSNHTFFITNLSNSPQYYTYYYQLICNGQYIRKIDNIRLEPNGRAQDAGIMYLNVYHQLPGNFPISAVTNVSGESASFAQDSATLSIIR